MLYIYYVLIACDMSSITLTFANILKMVLKLMDCPATQDCPVAWNLFFGSLELPGISNLCVCKES